MTKLVEHRDTWSGLLHKKPDEATVGILGIPFDNAVSWRSGTRHAPARLRSITPHLAFFTEEGTEIKPCIADYGDVESDLEWTRYFKTVQTKAAEVMNQHKLAFFIGGDHSVGIPLFKAFSECKQGKIGYIQFDSHPDLIDEFEGHKWSHACTARRHVEDTRLEPANLAFVGLRSYLSEEINYFNENPKVGRFSARHVYKNGIESVAHALIEQMKDCDAVYFSLDIDGLDPAYAPGTGTPEAGGLSTRECLELLHLLFENLPIQAMDLVEISPPLDHEDVTALAGLKIIYEVMGMMQEKFD